ncbi:MAG: DUF3592 domain-containing protein [Planctomycetia bacterium]|nr:DUF3592 domain-containing protein [Planctomycetia bacterium]
MIPITERPRSVQPKAVAICAAILLFGAWMAWFNLSGVWRAREWDSWKETKGTVIEGGARGRRESRRVSCEYTYTVDGTAYRNDVVTLMSGAGFQGGGATTPGGTVTLRYDPDDPSDSALAPGDAVNSWCWGGVGLAIAAFGAVLVLATAFPGRLPRFVGEDDLHEPGDTGQ